MPLLDHYAIVKLSHVGLVAVSGLLFALRGAAVLAGRHWPLAPAWRVASVAIDTGLLAAGATLWWLLALPLQSNPWLGAKLTLLLVYVVLGTLALKRAPTPAGRAAAYAAALACYLFMVSIALAHHPLGALR